MAKPELPTTQDATPLLDFDCTFELLTGHTPFPWQKTLYEKFAKGEIPPSCNLPTGLGKTSIITIWLIALANRARVPRRLVYVVNRRTVVDQTTNEAIRLHDNAARIGIDNLAISTLRGQLADNRAWSADPSRPAVICGTVDMIGSRLLFSGYGIGFRSRPLHAGFLGQDAMLIHDEAHLEPAFQELIQTIQDEQKRCNEFARFRVMELTATTRNDNGQAKEPLGLTPEEKNPLDTIPEPKDDEPSIYRVWRRFKAKKRLHLKKANDDGKIAEEIAVRALNLQKDDKGNDTNAAVLIFVRTLDDVKKVCTHLTNKKDGVPEDHIQQLTGTMRGLERDRMADPRRSDASRVFARFLKPPRPDAPENERWKTTPMPGTVYLVCTSAGEVGVDISADHLVCDLSTFESMVQRFGRVNRFGERDDTRIDVVHPVPPFGKKDKKTGELKADEIDTRRERTLELLKRLPSLDDNLYDASPKALGDLRQHTDLPCKIEDAFAPKPVIRPATDILFDAWALTSIRGPMPGRPEVASYLHGIADDLPQTTIAWRAELDLIDTKSPVVEKALQAIFAKHRIRPHETLTVGMTNQRGKWKFRAIDFLEEVTAKRPDLCHTCIAIQLPRGLRLMTISDLISNSSLLNTDPALVLPASFGGLNDKGMLSTDAIPSEPKIDDATLLLDIADVQGYERESGAKPRRRVLIERTGDGWAARAMPGAAPLPDDWNLEEPLKRSTLVKRIQEKSGLNVRLVQPIKWDDEGGSVCELVCLSRPPTQQKPVEQALDKHVNMVEEEARQLALGLGLCEPFRSALLFAAKWHDKGKNATIWQRYVGRLNGNGEPLGKSSEWRDPKLLGGYRHEFGSLLRIPDVEAKRYFSDQCNLMPEEQRDARDLALHLIAAHHGYGRPHFENIIDHDFTTQQSEDTHIEVMRRFARLQRRYGRWGLAYLESLLRAADWAASAAGGSDPEVDDDTPADLEGNEA